MRNYSIFIISFVFFLAQFLIILPQINISYADCRGNKDCKNGQICNTFKPNGVCEGKHSGGQDCTDNSWCSTNYCDKGKPTHCTGLVGCQGGTCDAPKKPASPQPNGAACKNDNQCKSNYCNPTKTPGKCVGICVPGVCDNKPTKSQQKANGSSCQKDVECKSNYCDQHTPPKGCVGICPAGSCQDKPKPKTSGTCSTDNPKDCADHYFCDTSKPPKTCSASIVGCSHFGTCQAKAKEGQPCEADPTSQAKDNVGNCDTGLTCNVCNCSVSTAGACKGTCVKAGTANACELGLREPPDISSPPSPPCAPGGWNANGQCTGFQTGLGNMSTNPGGSITKIFAILLSLSGGIALLLIIRAGYQMMTSQGKPEALQQAREQLTAAIIGLLFLIFAFVILQVIGVDILKIPNLK